MSAFQAPEPSVLSPAEVAREGRALEGRWFACERHEKVTEVERVVVGIAYLACGCFVVEEGER